MLHVQNAYFSLFDQSNSLIRGVVVAVSIVDDPNGFTLGTNIPSSDLLDCGPIRGVVVIRLDPIGYYVARPIF